MFQTHYRALFVEYDGVPRGLARRFLVNGYGRAWWNVERENLNPRISEVVDHELLKIDSGESWAEHDSRIMQEIEAL